MPAGIKSKISHIRALP